jgi:hypothetical protein
MFLGPRKWISENVSRQKSFSVHDERFQWKYILTFMLILGLVYLGSVLPILFFVNRNYVIFEKIAYDFYPSLIENLFQEKSWLWILFIFNLLTLMGLCTYFSLKFTKKILYPVHQIEEHLHQMMLGRWKTPISFEDSRNDLKSMKINYDYFHRSLKSNTEMELNLLKRIVVDPNNRDAFLAWQNLVESKAHRLGIDPEEIIKGSFYLKENEINLDFGRKKSKRAG